MQRAGRLSSAREVVHVRRPPDSIVVEEREYVRSESWMLPEYLNALVHALPEPCWLVSHQGKIFAANRAARNALPTGDDDLMSMMRTRTR